MQWTYTERAGPFYPPYALAHLEGASNFTVGLVFALCVQCSAVQFYE